MIYVVVYIIGFIMTLTSLKLLGKKIGIDYDPPHGHGYDDYDDNAQAYLFFSLFWVVVTPILLTVGMFKLLYKFTQWFLKYPNV